MLMAALSGALAVVKRFALGFSEKEIQQTQRNEMTSLFTIPGVQLQGPFRIKCIKRILFTESVILGAVLPFGFNTGLE